MNKYLKYGLISLVVINVGMAIYYFISKPNAEEHSAHKSEYYTCPMHPQIRKDKPGNCPICGMTLVKKMRINQKTDGDTIANQLLPTDNFSIGNYQTISPIDSIISEEIGLLGIVAYDQNSASNIAARVSGRIEKMYVNYKYQRVKNGQKLFDLYSPELLTEQQNFIYLIINDENNSSIIKAAKSKLLQYGMTNNQIAILIKNRKTNPIISIYSPTSGIISGTESKMPNASNEMQSTTTTTESLTVKEGDYIKKNETIFTLLNTNKVWGIFNIPQGYTNLIQVNQAIEISSEASQDDFITAKINFIENQLNASERTNRIRVYLENKIQKYPIGLRLTGSIKTKPVNGLWINKSAVVSIGNKRIVFKKINNGFKAHEIQTGVEFKDRIQVIKGITATDKIAKNGEYLIDSESFIKTE